MAQMGEKTVVHRVWRRNLKEQMGLEDPGVNRRIILKCILKK